MTSLTDLGPEPEDPDEPEAPEAPEVLLRPGVDPDGTTLGGFSDLEDERLTKGCRPPRNLRRSSR